MRTRICFLLLAATAVFADTKATLVEHRKVWDQGQHNAFTDLIQFKGKWYMTFRESQSHVGDDGALRVLVSKDGQAWESAALLTSKVADLRDPHLSITGRNELMLTGGIRHLKTPRPPNDTHAWFSADGKKWSVPVQIGESGLWLWNMDWYKGAAYSIGYDGGGEKFIRLYRSADGRKFERLWQRDHANESSIAFGPDGTAYCLLRRDHKPDNSGQIGIAKPPYTDWKWRNLNAQTGGPKMIRLPDGRFIATVRLYDGKRRTSVCQVDVENAKITEVLTLPSGGDTSYAGMVFYRGLIWMSYYSSHEGKTSIYFAKVRIE
ncbi:MAG: sialidase family protein [Bryobacteraceae bacterium]